MIILYGLDLWATVSPIVWWLRSQHHFCREFFMRTSEPKAHEINKLGTVLSIPKFETWLRKIRRTSESWTLLTPRWQQGVASLKRLLRKKGLLH